jgi:hypothetical protein
MKAHTYLSAVVAFTLGLSSVVIAQDSAGEPGRGTYDRDNSFANVYSLRVKKSF